MKTTGTIFRSIIAGFALLILFCGEDTITNDPIPDPDPLPNPNANPAIVYESTIINIPDIFVMDADGSNQFNLTNNFLFKIRIRSGRPTAQRSRI